VTIEALEAAEPSAAPLECTGEWVEASGEGGVDGDLGVDGDQEPHVAEFVPVVPKKRPRATPFDDWDVDKELQGADRACSFRPAPGGSLLVV